MIWDNNIRDTGWKGRKNFIVNIKSDFHCVKSLRIQSFSGPYFHVIGLNTNQKTMDTDTFHTGFSLIDFGFLNVQKFKINAKKIQNIHTYNTLITHNCLDKGGIKKKEKQF